jgi:hypothetical protein
VVKFAQGYYRRDTGDGYVCDYAMIDEPPLGQFVFRRGGAWVPLPDGFHLADRLITGEPDYDFVGPDPPAGVPRLPIEV